MASKLEGFSREKFSKSHSMGRRYHFLWKIYERGTFSIQNGIQNGDCLDLGAEGGRGVACDLSATLRFNIHVR